MSLRLAAATIGMCVAVAALEGASPARGPAPLTRGDLRWLARVTFGIDSATVAAYRRLGRDKFLDEQLHAPAVDPPDLQAAIAALTVAQKTAEARVRDVRAEQQRINTLASDD